MTITVADILADILRREGSTFTNIVGDRGGPTKYGITLMTLRQIFPEATVEQLADLTEQGANDIYTALYVKPLAPYAGDDNAFLALLVDSAVQHGINRVHEWLCVDKLGSYTQFLKRRIRFYGEIVHNDPSQSKFINGWLSRVTEFVR